MKLFRKFPSPRKGIIPYFPLPSAGERGNKKRVSPPKYRKLSSPHTSLSSRRERVRVRG